MTDANSSDYNQEEHERLMNAAASVLLATVAADRSGPVAYFEEMTAAGTYLYDARNRFADNALVQELYRRNLETRVTEESDAVTSESLLQEIDRVNETLRRDQEGMEFRRFLMELAQHVAKASRSGWFGPRISEEEKSFLAELSRRLGLEETT